MDKKVGRPRLEPTNVTQQKKRDYQRTYQENRKAKIDKLTNEIEKCEDELKDMKAKRKELRDMAKKKLDSRMVNKEFDPDEYKKGGMSYVRKIMK